MVTDAEGKITADQRLGAILPVFPDEQAAFRQVDEHIYMLLTDISAAMADRGNHHRLNAAEAMTTQIGELIKLGIYEGHRGVHGPTQFTTTTRRGL